MPATATKQAGGARPPKIEAAPVTGYDARVPGLCIVSCRCVGTLTYERTYDEHSDEWGVCVTKGKHCRPHFFPVGQTPTPLQWQEAEDACEQALETRSVAPMQALHNAPRPESRPPSVRNTKERVLAA